MKIDLDFLLPEIYTIFWLTLLVIQYSIFTRRRFLVLVGEKVRIFVINPIPSITALLLVLSIYYLTLQLYGGAKYKVYVSISGLYSTPVIYYMKIILSVLFVLYMLYLRADKKSMTFYSYEFYIVLFFAFLFLNFLLISSNFLNIFIFIELYGLCIYYLIASKKNSSRSVEAAIKYFIVGSVSSVILVFGIFLLYYATGSGDFLDISRLTFGTPYYQTNLPYLIGTYLVCISLLVKLGASVFFFWIVEVYGGISYYMLIFLNLFPKVVYVFVLFTLIDKFNLFHLSLLVKVLIASSLFIGLIGAITELKIKRFLVYTSVYNIAFFSLPFWFSNAVYTGTFLFFLTVYLLNTFIYMTLFASFKDWSTESTPKSLLDLYHLKAQNPQFSYLFIFFTFFASGLPMGALFLAKFSMFFELAKTSHLVILLFFILASSLSLFYYIRIVKIIVQGTPLPSFLVKPIPTTIAFLSSIMIWLNFIFILFFDKFVMLVDYSVY